ncbi:MAG: hypothetical protein QNJ17_06860 [Desulfocapsaceae bacterium]|nr:hypothetical protein [Desulfocapsaceae bacterium]
MKYLIIIIGLFSALTAVTLLILVWPDDDNSQNDPIVTINGQPLTRQKIADVKNDANHSESDADNISELITKHLLISEAQRRKLDREPTFRLALKNFYEQSLIDTLLQQVKEEIETETTAAEVDTYLQSYGRIFTFYTLKTSGSVNQSKIKSLGTKYITRFDDLDLSLRHALATMQPGETTTALSSQDERIAIYLEAIQGEPVESQNYDIDLIREQIHQMKIERQVNSWVENLRNKAEITYHTNQE